jgi:cell division protein FtsB
VRFPYTKYLFALWAGVLIYVTLSSTFGSKGVFAQHQLVREQERQEANIARLAEINRELENTMNSLLYDRDTLTVYAREQGYASSSERFIRVVGLGATPRIRTYPGNVVVLALPQYTPDQIIRIIALCTGIAILVCMVIFDILRFLKER